MKKLKLIYLAFLTIAFAGAAYAESAIDSIVRKASSVGVSEVAKTDLAFDGTTLWLLVATLFICFSLTGLAFEVAQHFDGITSASVSNNMFSTAAAIGGGAAVAAGKTAKGLYKWRKESQKGKGNETTSIPSAKSAGTNSFNGNNAGGSNGNSDGPNGNGGGSNGNDVPTNNNGATVSGNSNNTSNTNRTQGGNNTQQGGTSGQTQTNSAVNRKQTPADSSGTNATLKTFPYDNSVQAGAGIAAGQAAGSILQKMFGDSRRRVGNQGIPGRRTAESKTAPSKKRWYSSLFKPDERKENGINDRAVDQITASGRVTTTDQGNIAKNPTPTNSAVDDSKASTKTFQKPLNQERRNIHDFDDDNRKVTKTSRRNIHDWDRDEMLSAYKDEKK